MRLAFRMTRMVIGWLALAIGLFMATAWIGSSIPRNSDWHEANEGIDILVGSNGVHTELVLPATTAAKDWRAQFPLGDVAEPLATYTHVAISWGEREVFLSTPTWADLSPVTVLRIIGIGGEGLMHISWYVRPSANEHYRRLKLDTEQYSRLVAAIEAGIPEGPLAVHSGYGSHDAFYETGGRYTFKRTCNQWTSDMLAAAGAKTGWWTPFAGGVMKWVPQSR